MKIEAVQPSKIAGSNPDEVDFFKLCDALAVHQINVTDAILYNC
jgi:hypothetical protein